MYNYHSADLPKERGAGCITWRILLNKEKFNNLNIHKVDKTFDTGEVVFKIKIKNFKNPRPIDIYKHQEKLESDFLKIF